MVDWQSESDLDSIRNSCDVFQTLRGRSKSKELVFLANFSMFLRPGSLTSVAEIGFYLSILVWHMLFLSKEMKESEKRNCPLSPQY